MTKKTLRNLVLITASATLFSFDLPKGWFSAGSQPAKYDMGTETVAGRKGKAATIRSIEQHTDGFGTLMQSCDPGKFLGKRVRMSGYMKSKDVSGWAGFWLRVDQEASKEPLSFDNMGNRPVKGTTDWQKYEIVLDVPANASHIAYGALINEGGQIWFDDLKFEIVDDTVPATNILDEKN